MNNKLLLVLYSFCFYTGIHAQKILTSVDSLISYASSKSISLQSGNIKLDRAKKAKLAAALSIPDVSGNLSFSYTNNTKMPVNLFPAEIFGGAADTYKEVQSGILYVSYGNEKIDIKLINPKGWENLKLYKLNVESNISDNKITLKSLEENIAASYFNIVSLQEQASSIKENITAAENLLSITQNKYDEGLIKQQDVNDAKVNCLTAKENLNQVNYLIKQQYITLKILSTNSLGKYFYEPVKFKVLDGISFEAYKGEFLTLVGKSSGKSTLLYCLSTMDTSYEGELYISNEKITGKKVNELAALRNRSIGFIFQFHYLLTEFTCLKNVMIQALKLGKYSYKEVEEKAYNKLEVLGIKDQALKPASKLSGGQQQRVSIARALINDPALIMCDEPTGNLDSKNTQVVFEIFKQIAHEFGRTIIAVTHDNDFAAASDRTIELADGKIINHDKIFDQ